MSTSLVPINFDKLPATQLGSDSDFDSLAGTTDFLPRLQFYSKGDPGAEIKPGHYGLPMSESEVDPLGDTVDILPLARRPKALDTSVKPAISAYEVAGAEFQRIKETAGGKDTGCMFGYSFLVIERTTGRILELFFGTASSRPEGKKVCGFCPLTSADIANLAAAGRDVTGLEPHGPQAVTLGSRLVKTQKFQYYVPVVRKCTTPFATLPSADAIAAEITRFMNVKDDVQQAAEGTGRAR